MSTSSTRHPPPPSLSIKVPTLHTRSSSAPALTISSYSQRIPRSRTPPQLFKEQLAARSRLEEQSNEESELEKVTVAQVTKPLPLPTHRRTPVHVISFGVQPPTPSNSSSVQDPMLYRKSPPKSGLQSVKQQRRSASIYSSISTTNATIIDPSLPYLRPTSVSLSHFNISQDSLASSRSTSQRSSSCDTSSSITVRPTHLVPPSSSDDVQLPLHPISFGPIPRTDPPNYCSSTNSSAESSHLPAQSRPSVHHPSTLPPDQTPAAERRGFISVPGSRKSLHEARLNRRSIPVSMSMTGGEGE